jgi:hypothetical protein
MARKTKGGGGSPAASPAPIKGALAEEGEGADSSALAMVMDRLEALQREQLAQARGMERLLTATTENMTRVQQEVNADLKAERLRSEAAFNLVAKKFQELAEAKPADPKTEAQLIKAELAKAKTELLARRKRFKDSLETMTTGTVQSHEPHPISVGVNGYYFVIQPGENKNVPTSFIEEWERRQRTQKWAVKVADAFEVHDEVMQEANAVQTLTGRPALWDEDTGAI